jgi:hypothetical protein
VAASLVAKLSDVDLQDLDCGRAKRPKAFAGQGVPEVRAELEPVKLDQLLLRVGQG